MQSIIISISIDLARCCDLSVFLVFQHLYKKSDQIVVLATSCFFPLSLIGLFCFFSLMMTSFTFTPYWQFFPKSKFNTWNWLQIFYLYNLSWNKKVRGLTWLWNFLSINCPIIFARRKWKDYVSKYFYIQLIQFYWRTPWIYLKSTVAVYTPTIIKRCHCPNI